MNRTQTACFMLMASAFVLTGVLLVQVGNRLTPEAHAEMVLKAGGISMMTAITREGEESLFLLDDASQRLLVYTSDPARKRLERQAVLDLGNAFRTRVDSRSGDAAGDIPRGATPR